MTNPSAQKGTRAERECMELFAELGYRTTLRFAASHGPADFVAVGDKYVTFVEVKSTRDCPPPIYTKARERLVETFGDVVETGVVLAIKVAYKGWLLLWLSSLGWLLDTRHFKGTRESLGTWPMRVGAAIFGIGIEGFGVYPELDSDDGEEIVAG